MADRTSIQFRIRTADRAHFEDEWACDPDRENRHVTICECEEGIPDIAEIAKLGRPFYGTHGSYSGAYSAFVFAFDGITLLEHATDEDGELAIPGLLDALQIVTPSIPDFTVEFIAHYQRCMNLVHTDLDACLPPDWSAREANPPSSFVDLAVPAAVLAHAKSFYGTPRHRVIGQFYAGEDVMLHVEDIADDRAELLAEGWPAVLLDKLESIDKSGMPYVRLVV